MSKIINITERLSKERSKIVIGEKTYEVNDGVDNVFRFEELISDATLESIVKAIEISLGEEAVKELEVSKMSASNYRILSIAILAAMQNITYEEAEGRFRKA